jgi:hypothetical protein
LRDGSLEFFGIIEHRQAGCYCLGHIQCDARGLDGVVTDEVLEEAIENGGGCETISRPMQPEFIRDWFAYVMRRPQYLDSIKWRDERANCWPFETWQSWFKRDPQGAAG